MRDPTGLPRAVTTSRTSAAPALQRAKLRPPCIPDHYLPRPRLLELFDDVARAPLTLVIAPLGISRTANSSGSSFVILSAPGILTSTKSNVAEFDSGEMVTDCAGAVK